MLEHNFNGTPFTVGIEEELMLLDPQTLNLTPGIETILEAVPADYVEQVKPELFQSVLEIATRPCAGVAEATGELGELRSMVCGVAAEHGMRVGAAGSHPFALCRDQEIVQRERYLELYEELQFVARQELIFGIHVHVGIDAADKAIYVADGIRRYLPLLLALSANSPFWEGQQTGMQSARTAAFRSFPRVGIPPHYGTWEIFSGRVEQMMRSGAIADYTYLWWDVRPHPNIGTVETRVFDQASELADTAAFAALTQALAHRLARVYAEREPLVEVPHELVDDNKVRAAIRGIDGELLDVTEGHHRPARELGRRLLDELEPSAVELGCAEQLSRIAEILDRGTASAVQLRIASENGGDLRAVVEQAIRLEP